MTDTLSEPTFDDVLAAAARIAPHAHVTPILNSSALDAEAGAALAFKGEHLQRIGAFKFRGACNAVWSLTEASVNWSVAAPAAIIGIGLVIVVLGLTGLRKPA